LGPLHTADIADLLQLLDVEEQIVCLKRLETQRAAEVLAELDAKSGQALLTLLSDHEVGKILEELPSDDAADLISSLTPEKTERVEALLPTEDREDIQELLEFGADTAGGLMQVERVAVRDNATIQEAIDVVRRAADDVESPQRVYVVNQTGKLVGELSILDLVIKPPHARVCDVMQLSSVAVPVDMDQKQVAAMFSKYDEFTMPVVDGQSRLVGRITMDDIIDVLEEEKSKDLTRIAGTTDQELGETSIYKVSRSRLPWLITGFIGQGIGVARNLRGARVLHPVDRGNRG
jgi:magnesium transporter